ncbi:DUF998 domain-containing protein [Actinomadura sp. WMMB 499]|uniref:DUF998 domain-containing protein n=1 Tax=Actinomadura sp. WMMB 499 TaxID=1219491 RepID=UPI00124485B9|nr:DUF998 domain-containing protein [Actinomadura sp. WMMB 499]QFG24333.1 DUF998 domain-containing protein [Actinomadura sp. WMMB 499]
MTAALWAGTAGAWAFVAVFVLDGWTRPGYRPVRHPVSALALGSRGGVQAANFVVCGLAVMAGAVAVAGRPDGAVLAVAIGVFGASLVASGVFPMDAMRGYPPGTPDETPEEVSLRHRAHDWAGVAVFTSLPVAAFAAAFAVPDPGWKWYSGLTGAALLAGFFAFGQAWETDSRYAGLVQRAVIIVGWLWLGMLFAYAATAG